MQIQLQMSCDREIRTCLNTYFVLILGYMNALKFPTLTREKIVMR